MSITRYELTVHLETASPLHSGGIDEVVDRARPSKKRETVPRRFARDKTDRPVPRRPGPRARPSVTQASPGRFDATATGIENDSHEHTGHPCAPPPGRRRRPRIAMIFFILFVTEVNNGSFHIFH